MKLGQSVGTKTVVEKAQSLGLTGIQGGDASVVLGTSETTLLQMTSAYAVLANRGRAVFPYGITKVSDAAGRVLFQQSEFEGALLVEAQPLAKIVDVMTATVEWGTGKAARLERPAAGKTGTSQDFRDAWFVGYTAELVTGVWFGNDDNSPTDRVTGGGLPAETWAAFSARALAGESAKPLPGASTPLEPVGAPPEVVAGGSDDFIGGLLNSLRGVLSGEEGSSGSQGGGGLLRNTPDYPEEDRPGGQ
ncbi:MAG: penicillin-binding transpeptidase domain-containing protein [Limibacillus sp.]